MISSTENFDEPLPAPQAALDQLQISRDAILQYQTEVEARLKAAQDEIAKAHEQAKAAREQLAQTQADCQQWKNDCAALQEKHDALHSQLQHRQSQVQQLEAQTREHQSREQELREQLDAQNQKSKNLHAELMEVYRDLRAEDLPTLILRVGMNLVGAQNGLFAGPQGDQTLAAIGLDDLPEPVAQALYRFTSQAAQTEEPVVCNDSNELPDGAALVNLAAMPVSVQGHLRGVILVANKREGIFDDDDTELLLAIGRHAGIALENQRLHCALGEAFVSTVAVLADAVEAKDPYTRGHCESVSELAARVAERMNWDKAELDQIRYAALLHDVGKLGVPDGILLKSTPLSPEEYKVIQTHVAIGRDLVSRVPILEPIVPFVYLHHERWDGGGYPEGRAGEEIPLGARIIGAVDALDAMITKRPYREPVSLQEASAEMQRCAGTQFDPGVVQHLVQVLEQRAPSAFQSAH
jgi:HD-GYP domain-containing protein (c-di-GMP phosphodiesterase class II)